nr:CoA-transferase [uncultured Bacillus sp.]
MSKVISAEEAAKLIPNEAVVACTGFGLGMVPEEVYLAIRKRFDETGFPKNLTFMWSAGNGNGKGRGANVFGVEGLIKKVIAGFVGNNPDVSNLVMENKIECLGLPQGVVPQLYREIAAHRPGLITKIGLGTYVDPRIEGAKLSPCTEDYVELMNIKGEEYLFYPSFPINAGLIRGTYADEDGNIVMDKEGLLVEALPIAQAVRNSGGIVIAQVEKIVKKGSLDPKQVRVPGIMVDHLVIAKPEYHFQTQTTQYDPALSNEVKVPVESLSKLPFNDRKVIARRASVELGPNTIVNLGLGIPITIGSIAAEEDVSQHLTLTTEVGVVGGIPGSGGDFGLAYNADAILEQQAQFDFIDGGGLDLTVLGLAEADEQGNINVSKFGKRANGPGGAINIAQTAKKIVFAGTFTAGGLKTEIKDGKLHILEEGKAKKFKKQVQQITFGGQRAASINQFVLYVTERAVFQLIDGKVTLIEMAPGVDLQKDILDQMEFTPVIAKDLKEMDPTLFSETWGGLKEIIATKANVQEPVLV